MDRNEHYLPSVEEFFPLPVYGWKPVQMCSCSDSTISKLSLNRITDAIVIFKKPNRRLYLLDIDANGGIGKCCLAVFFDSAAFEMA